MGLFLTMLTCKALSREKVIEGLTSIMNYKGFTLKLKEKVNSIDGKDGHFDVTDVKNGWVQIFCPETPDDKLPQLLSKNLAAPVFEFHIHGGDFWMYQLFVSGELKDRHNPIPDYWSQIGEEEYNSWKGNSDILSHILHTPKSKIEPYIIFWNKTNIKDNHKAFTSDRFSVKDEWAMVDFQEKFGIEYPNFEKPETVDLVRLYFEKKKSKIMDFLGKFINKK